MYLTQILLLVLQLLHFSAAKKSRTKYGYYHKCPHDVSAKETSSSSMCYFTHTATASSRTFTPSSLITSIISTESSPTLTPPTNTGTFTTSETESAITPSTAQTTPTSTSTNPSTALTTSITTSTVPPTTPSVISSTTSSALTSTTSPTTTETTTSTTSPTTTETTTSTVSSTSTSASPTCTDISGDFVNGVLSPWYISDQITADSRVVNEGVGDTPYSFALIPSQTSVAQVYLNQLLPSCGNPPPLVTLTVRFQYQFTGESEVCTIRAVVNRNPPTELLEIVDVDIGAVPGEWQSFEGTPIEVQLTYDPLFTIQLDCLENNPGIPAILITNISVY